VPTWPCHQLAARLPQESAQAATSGYGYQHSMRAVALAVGLTAMLTGCEKDAERAPEERRNLAALRTVPVPAGAVTVSTETLGEHAPDTSEGPIVAWSTVRELRLARALATAAVVETSRRGLRRAGWRVEGGADFYLNARRDRTCLHLLALPEPPAPPETAPTEALAGESGSAESAPDERVARGLLLKVRDC
jgi:hypothetical protein